jgi:hypothetical protein
MEALVPFSYLDKERQTNRFLKSSEAIQEKKPYSHANHRNEETDSESLFAVCYMV